MTSEITIWNFIGTDIIHGLFFSLGTVPVVLLLAVALRFVLRTPLTPTSQGNRRSAL